MSDLAFFAQLAMSKADEQDERKDATEGSVKSPAETTPDVIPPVHVLEAAQQQDRRETEDLLAGFDRPGRSPRRVPSGDFVDYFSKKKGERDAGARSSVPTAKAGQGVGRRDAETVIIPRKKEMPAWVLWVGAAAVMVTLGASVAYVATADAPERPSASSVPSAATTITSALPVATATATTSTRDIPLPDPVATTTEIVTAAPAPAPAPAPKTKTQTTTTRRDPAASAAPNAATSQQAPPPEPPPSNGYIRTFPSP